jgi:hypothetical protein
MVSGPPWSLDIQYSDRSVHTHRDNNYPGPDGMPTGQPEETNTFQSFVAAASSLLGKREFRLMLPDHVKIVEGDLLDQDVEVILNAWNRNVVPWWLLLPQGVSGAIKRRAGY